MLNYRRLRLLCAVTKELKNSYFRDFMDVFVATTSCRTAVLVFCPFPQLAIRLFWYGGEGFILSMIKFS